MTIDVPAFDEIEANLARLQTRIPHLAISGLLLGRLFLHLGRGLSTLLDLELRPFGIAEVEFRVLMTLFSEPAGTAYPSELCARTSQSPATMSRISDALVGRDLITRVASVHDRRKTDLRITAQGEELVRRVLPALHAALRRLFQDLAEPGRQTLIDQLKRVGSHLDEALTGHDAAPGPDEARAPDAPPRHAAERPT
jgi:MarR family transcriptional repressor of emrRAB